MQKETQKSIAQWAETTFGTASDHTSLIDRTLIEIEELRSAVKSGSKTDTSNELADVLIILYRLAELNNIDLTHAINHKMAINRSRRWEQAGDGTGKHIN